MARGARATYSMKELIAAVNAMTGGKGGGREDSAQGSARVRPGFAETLTQLQAYLVRALGAEA